MAIVFDCVCGRRIRAKDGSVGRVVDCPACGVKLEVPAPDGLDLGIDMGADEIPMAFSPAQSPTVEAVTLRQTRYKSRPSNRSELQRVIVVDFDMPFWSLVWVILKFQFASLIASAIIAVLAIPVVILILIAHRLGQ